MQSGLYDGIWRRDRTVEVRIQSSSSTEQDGTSNQHVKEVEEIVPLGLNTLLNVCRLIILGIISQPNLSEQLTGILFFMTVVYNNSKTITLYTMLLS